MIIRCPRAISGDDLSSLIAEQPGCNEGQRGSCRNGPS